MQNLQTILSILIPLFLGFFIVVPKPYLRWIDAFIGYLVYAILWLIGVGLAQTENLFRELDNIVFYAVLLFSLLMFFNIISLVLLDKYLNRKANTQSTLVHSKFNFSGSLKQFAMLFLGVGMGFWLPENWLPHHDAGLYALMLLVFSVGMLLRGNYIALKSVLLNRYGMQISAVMMLSSAVAGVVFSWLIPDVSTNKGLALSAGYGWYSLSGIMMTQAYGATWGSVALLNDLLREFFALAFIPLLMSRSMAAAIGVGGATSLDFTLPIIQKSGGLAAVPIAISFGFVVNVLSPLLMALFI